MRSAFKETADQTSQKQLSADSDSHFHVVTQTFKSVMYSPSCRLKPKICVHLPNRNEDIFYETRKIPLKLKRSQKRSQRHIKNNQLSGLIQVI